MRLVVTFVLGSTMFLGACSAGTYRDAGPEVAPLPAQNFDVGSSGTDTCPGELYGVASQNNATCSHATENCVSTQGDAQLGEIQCTCTGPDGGQGLWECHMLMP